MNNDFKQMYDNIHMDEGRKNRVRSAIIDEYNCKRPFMYRARKGLIAVAASFILLLGTGFASLNVTTANIVYASESEIELAVNCWDKVIGVNPLNEIGQKTACELDLKHCKYGDAIELLHEYESEHYGEVCAADACVTVNCRSEKRSERMKNHLESCGHKMAHVNQNGYGTNEHANEHAAEHQENCTDSGNNGNQAAQNNCAQTVNAQTISNTQNTCYDNGNHYGNGSSTNQGNYYSQTCETDQGYHYGQTGETDQGYHYGQTGETDQGNHYGQTGETDQGNHYGQTGETDQGYHYGQTGETNQGNHYGQTGESEHSSHYGQNAETGHGKNHD